LTIDEQELKIEEVAFTRKRDLVRKDRPAPVPIDMTKRQTRSATQPFSIVNPCSSIFNLSGGVVSQDCLKMGLISQIMPKKNASPECLQMRRFAENRLVWDRRT
jgi:hypothetical protein